MSLAERFWSLARAREEHSSDPVEVVRHVLAILDSIDAGETGAELSVHTVSFLALLRQSEARGDMQYASPEQARGESLDERSLVFSAGVLIFEKLTGRHPFGAEANPNRLARIRRAEMASGVSYFQTISGPLRTILLRCMGPFPQDRWSSLAELRKELEDFVNGATTRSQGYSLPALPASPIAGEPPPVPRRRLARASSWALNVAADRESKRREDSVAELAAPQPSLWLRRAGWMIAGGLVASAFFLTVGARSGGEKPNGESDALTQSPIPAAAARAALLDSGDSEAPSPVETEGPAAPKPTVSSLATEKDETPTARDEPAAAKPPAKEASPEAIGESALLAARDCFAESRLRGGLEVGMSMHLSPNRETAKVFFGGTTLENSERTCLKDALVDASRGAAPAEPVTIAYSFFIDNDGGRVRARVKE